MVNKEDLYENPDMLRLRNATVERFGDRCETLECVHPVTGQPHSRAMHLNPGGMSVQGVGACNQSYHKPIWGDTHKDYPAYVNEDGELEPEETVTISVVVGREEMPCECDQFRSNKSNLVVIV